MFLGYITVGAVQDKEWKGLCAALDRPDWITDERFATGAARNINRGERFECQALEISKFTSAEIMERCNQHQVPNGPVNHPRDKVLTDPQVVQNQLVFRTTHPHAPYELRQARPAAQFSSAPFELTRHAPLLGEHTHDVLTSVAGLSDVHVSKLLDEKVVLITEARKPVAGKLDPKKLSLLSG